METIENYQTLKKIGQGTFGTVCNFTIRPSIKQANRFNLCIKACEA